MAIAEKFVGLPLWTIDCTASCRGGKGAGGIV